MNILPIQFQCQLCGMEIEGGINRIGIVIETGAVICHVVCDWCHDERYYAFSPVKVLTEHCQEKSHA